MRLLLLGSVLLTLSAAEPAFCDSRRCTCVRGGGSLDQTVTEEAQRSAAVFSGRVLRVEQPRLSLAPIESEADPSLRVYIEVNKRWKGVPVDMVMVLNSPWPEMCGADLRVGTTYLIYAESEEAGPLSVSSCSRTTPLKKVQRKELRILDRLLRAGSLRKPHPHAA